MRLKVFDTIDSTLDLLEKNHSFYREVEDELHEYIEFDAWKTRDGCGYQFPYKIKRQFT